MSDAERLARLEEKMSALARAQDELEAELGDRSRPGSVRARLHDLESITAAMNAATAATEFAREAVREAKRERWTKKELVFAGTVAGAATLGPIVGVLGIVLGK